MRIWHCRRKCLATALICLLSAMPRAALAESALKDPTAEALDRCLNDAANASTSGQTDCEATASSDYDRRMNAAYATLLRQLPRQAAQKLRLSQRAWLAFRDAEAKARDALYETRQGTMYVPMQAADATNVIRDRALELEGYVRVMEIDE
ncbi:MULTISPECIES: lysozyme inhibitor LprI family protein [unclassified Mesorhizobium]|uniref:lysozyme inhibitor LprI family protein n=1 Tax=unclassified Mesorhizobium TaxID=325217 RepID=UPI001CCBC8BF|nr:MULTISPECIES: lysozyme inhibitor LprI family protein [unclassified Mesorhizobium]MBZ9743470.1 lysozyme inhibitor LprI family protein [Mesorhizobium sp. CO1-1-4]